MKVNGGRHATYDTLKEAEIGDIVFSFGDSMIRAIGVVTGLCVDTPKPETFGKDDNGWASDGQAISVDWKPFAHPFAPQAHLDHLKPLFAKFVGLTATEPRESMQGTYMSRITQALSEALEEIACEADGFAVLAAERSSEDAIERAILNDRSLSETTRTAIIQARRGQGPFRRKLIALEKRCRLTETSNPDFLTASHIKPWAISNSDERLDEHNGLLLAPHVDRLFDKGWISFSDDGTVLVSCVQAESVIKEWRLLEAISVRSFSAKQRAYLAYHREHLFGKKYAVNSISEK